MENVYMNVTLHNYFVIFTPSAVQKRKIVSISILKTVAFNGRCYNKGAIIQIISYHDVKTLQSFVY